MENRRNLKEMSAHQQLSTGKWSRNFFKPSQTYSAVIASFVKNEEVREAAGQSKRYGAHDELVVLDHCFSLSHTLCGRLMSFSYATVLRARSVPIAAICWLC